MSDSIATGCSFVMILVFITFLSLFNWDEFTCHFQHMGSMKQLQCFKALS
jgi:hypothetical protein